MQRLYRRTRPEVPRLLYWLFLRQPAYDGPEEAVDELERAITELGLSGVKLYPSYQHWSVEDSEVAFPVFAKAEELGIPVLVHLGGSTIIDTTMSPPAKLDIVGRTFRDLKVIIGHGGMPWGREALFMLMKHPNFYTELSWWASCLTREDLYRYLRSCKPFFVRWPRSFSGRTIRVTARWNCERSSSR